MSLREYTLAELSIMIVGIIGSIGGLVTICQHSKCTRVSCSCSKGLECTRPVAAILKESTQTLETDVPPRATR